MLEEVEPLLFGLARSLAPSGEDAHERAVAVTHALTLAFHLRAERGEIALKTANELRAYCHGAVARKLADTDPLLLPEDAGDNETASLVYKCLGLGLTIAAELDDTERTALVARLEGAPATEGPWRARLARLRVLRA